MSEPKPKDGESLPMFLARSALYVLFFTVAPVMGIYFGMEAGNAHGHALAAFCAAVLFINRTKSR